ncbi:MAG: hypothetical protein ACQEP3_02575 [Patescibacteria group bacterium]
MKKVIITTLLLSLLVVGVAHGQGNFDDVMRRIEESTTRIKGEARERIGENLGQKVREMRQSAEQEGEDFGSRVREMVQTRTQELREERQEQADQARERFQERMQELPDQARRFSGLPEGLNKMKGQVTSRYEAFLEDVEEIITELDSEELTSEQEEELSSIEEEATTLWEELPEKSAKSYYEEFEDEEDMSFVADMIQSFRDDHVGFMQSVLSLRQDAQKLYEEVTGEEFEDEEDEEEGPEEESEEDEENEEGEEEVEE